MVYRRNSTFTRRDSGEYVRDDGKERAFDFCSFFIQNFIWNSANLIRVVILTKLTGI